MLLHIINVWSSTLLLFKCNRFRPIYHVVAAVVSSLLVILTSQLWARYSFIHSQCIWPGHNIPSWIPRSSITNLHGSFLLNIAYDLEFAGQPLMNYFHTIRESILTRARLTMVVEKKWCIITLIVTIFELMLVSCIWFYN